MTDNIFDLSKIAGSSSDVEKKIPVITEKDIDKSLIGYELVVPDEWKRLQYGTLIRYLRKDGAFRKGGVVQGVCEITDSSGENIVKIEMKPEYVSSMAKWAVTSSNIEKIWAKQQPKSSFITPIHGLEDIKEDLEMCKNSIKQISKEIQKMHSEQMRIVNLIKKLHHIS
jgi:hypothetical protein